jgi:hypothetical protein
MTQLPTVYLGLIQYRPGGPKSRLPYARDWRRELGIKEAAKPVGRCRASNVLIATSFSGPVALIMSGAARCPTRMSGDTVVGDVSAPMAVVPSPPAGTRVQTFANSQPAYRLPCDRASVTAPR